MQTDHFGKVRFASPNGYPVCLHFPRDLAGAESLLVFDELCTDTADPTTALDSAETAYLLAQRYDALAIDACVDFYYRTVAFSWESLRIRGLDAPPDEAFRRAWALYHSSLAKLITTGQRHGRLDPHSGLVVETPAGAQRIEMSYNGFVFRPTDFDRLILVGSYSSRQLTHIHRRSGLGVPLVVARLHQEGGDPANVFLGDRSLFSATAILRPDIGTLCGQAAAGYADVVEGDEESAPPSVAPAPIAIELYDPLRIREIDVCGVPRQLTRDISAPLAAAFAASRWQPFRAFMSPATARPAQLRMIEPYQRGKIPLLFVHGLVSDPLTYVDVVNELRADPRLNARYQYWAFDYPTGAPFLESATKLRAQLTAAYRVCRAKGADPALDQMTIVGHSMGGLVAQLQVTESRTILWDHIANRPLSMIVATTKTRKRLEQALFFRPLPFVQRVVFVATPHHGSPWATGPVGLAASTMVSFSQQDDARHQKLVRDNAGVFVPEVQDSMPTSIDLLKRDHPILVALRKMPFRPGITLHSIVGTGHRMLVGGRGDGVVPACSARLAGAQSELDVNALHTTILRHPATIAEIERILFEHLATSVSSSATVPDSSLAPMPGPVADRETEESGEGDEGSSEEPARHAPTDQWAAEVEE
ncbi:MAG: esterase/lipase family protein [Pirellulales bacterium]